MLDSLPPCWASSWLQIFLSSFKPSNTDSWAVSFDKSRAFSFLSNSSCRLRRLSCSTSASRESRRLWKRNKHYTQLPPYMSSLFWGNDYILRIFFFLHTLFHLYYTFRAVTASFLHLISSEMCFFCSLTMVESSCTRDPDFFSFCWEWMRAPLRSCSSAVNRSQASFTLTSLRGQGREVKHLKNHLAWSLYQMKHIYGLTEMECLKVKTPRRVWQEEDLN